MIIGATLLKGDVESTPTFVYRLIHMIVHGTVVVFHREKSRHVVSDKRLG